MSQERVVKTLESLGLSNLDAKVYVLLGKRGPQKAKDIGGTLKIPKQQLYPILNNLQSKGIINATLEHPAKFSALSFEKVLDLFVKAKIKEVQEIQQGQAEILSDWQSIAIKESPKNVADFTVLKGRNHVYSKIKQMVEQTKNQLLIISTVAGLVRADQFGVFDAHFKNTSKSKIQIRYLTKLSQQNARNMQDLLQRPQRGSLVLEGKIPNWEQQVSTRLAIRDQEEALFFITPENDKTAQTEDACLWTNCKPLVEAFIAVFEDFWRNATPIQEAISQIETGQPMTQATTAGMSAKTREPEAANRDQQEIFMLTSSEGLIGVSKRIMQLKEWHRRGISVKIMAPFTIQNSRIAQLLSECCEVKNVPTNWLNSALVGGKTLFQFRYPPSHKERIEQMAFLEDSFHSQSEEKTKKLEKMWEAT